MTAAFTSTNPCGLDGIDFVELAGPDPDALHRLLVGFGFARTMHHPRRAIDLYQQHDITMLLHRGPGFATRFAAAHGPAITGMGWRTSDAAAAAAAAVSRGARPSRSPRTMPAASSVCRWREITERCWGNSAAIAPTSLGPATRSARTIARRAGSVTARRNGPSSSSTKRAAARSRDIIGAS